MTDLTHLLVFDMTNILYKTFYVNTGKNTQLNEDEMNDVLLPKLAFHNSLITLNKYYRQHKPDKIIFVYDRPNWRVDHTKDETTYSRKVYKGHRRQSMTPKQQEMYNIFKRFVGDFESNINETTAIIGMAADKLEADDIIAGICKKYGGPDTVGDNGSTLTDVVDNHCVTIVSADKDMLQCLRYQNVQIIDPATGNNRELPPGTCVGYYLYEKYIRGDSGDNIPSAYPRLRSTKILEAFNDSFKHTNLMNHEWQDMDGNVVVVKDVVNENKLLVNLTHQPHDIQEILWQTIESSMNAPRRFDMFKFLKFLGKYELKNISKSLDYLTPMLQNKKLQ
jgi:5'-3' exonuclease